MTDINPEELKDRLDKGEEVRILDVREEWEYEEYNINGKLIPLGRLPFELEKINEWKNEEVIVHCKSGVRSHQAKKFLETRGFENIKNLIGGIDAYVQL